MSVPVYIYTDQTFSQKIRTQVIEFGSTTDISFGVGIRFNTPPVITTLINKISAHSYSLLTVGFAEATFEDDKKITFRVLSPKNFFQKNTEKYTYSPNKIIRPLMNFPADAFRYTVLHHTLLHQATPGAFTIKKTGNTIITANFPGVRNPENHTVNIIPGDFTATIDVPDSFQLTPTNKTIGFSLISAHSIEDSTPVDARLTSVLCSTPGITYNTDGIATITQANDIEVDYILSAQYYNNLTIHRTIRVLKYTPDIQVTNRIIRYGDIFRPDITIDTPQEISVKINSGHQLIGTSTSHIPYKKMGEYTALNTGTVRITIIVHESPLYNAHQVEVDIEIIPAIKDYDVTLETTTRDREPIRLDHTTINYIDYTNTPIPFTGEGETTAQFPPSISAEIIDGAIVIHSIEPEPKYGAANPQFTITTRREDPLFEKVDKTYTVEIRRIPDILFFPTEVPIEIVLNTEISDEQWVDIPLESTGDYTVVSANRNIIDAVKTEAGFRMIMRTANRTRITVETVERPGHSRDQRQFNVRVLRKSRSAFPLNSTINGVIPGTGGTFTATITSILSPVCEQTLKGTATFTLDSGPYAVLYYDDAGRINSRLVLDDALAGTASLTREDGTAIDREINLSGVISGYSYYLQKMGAHSITASKKEITIQVHGVVNNDGGIFLEPDRPTDAKMFHPTSFNRELCIEFDVTDTFLPGDVIQFQHNMPSGFALYSYELVFDAFETSI